jgi:hypothetical protein
MARRSLRKFGFFRGGFAKGRVAQIGHALLYRSHQPGCTASVAAA